MGRCWSGRRRTGWGRAGETGRGGLDLGVREGAATSDVRGAVGEVEAGGAAAEAEEGGVEGAGGFLGGVVGAQPDALPAVGEADLRHPLPPLALPHPLVLA